MAKITWDNRADSGSNSAISASIFNETKASVNAVYDILEAQIGTTSTDPTANLVVSGNLLISGNILPAVPPGDNTSSFSLGSETAAWKDLFVSTGSIKFVSPGGGVTSFGTSDVDKIKAGKFPVTSRTVGGITFNDWAQNDVIFSSVSDSTRIDLSDNGRMQFIAGNTTYLQMSDLTDSIFIGNPSVIGPRTTTYLNDTTIVPTGSLFKINTGSVRFTGTRATAPPPTGLYTGVMTATNNGGIGIVKVINGDNTYVSAPTSIPVVTDPKPIAFTEGTPQFYTDPSPGRAEYDNGKFIQILADAPFNTGFSISCSFNIPFSASAATFQKVEVILSEIPNPEEPYTNQPTWNSATKRTFILDPALFPNGIATGSFAGTYRLKGSPYTQQFVTESVEGKPYAEYSDVQLSGLLDFNRPLQLRIKADNIGTTFLDDSDARVALDPNVSLTHTPHNNLLKPGASPIIPYFDSFWYQDLGLMRRLDGNDWWQLQFSDFPQPYSRSPFLYNGANSHTLDREYIIPVNDISTNPNGHLVNEPITGFQSKIPDMVVYKAPFKGTYKFKTPLVKVNAWAQGRFGTYTFLGGWGDQIDATSTDTFTIKMKRESLDGTISDLIDINGRACEGSQTIARSSWSPRFSDLGDVGLLPTPGNVTLVNVRGTRVNLQTLVAAQYIQDSTTIASDYLEVELEQGDKIFFTLTANEYSYTGTGRADKYSFIYLGVGSETNIIELESATYESNDVTINKVNSSQGNAFFRLLNENYPNQSPLDCYTSNVDLGISQAGATIANGGFLCVGPLSGSAEPEFGGQQGNFISCSADNVIAVGKNNVIGKDNSVTVGFGNRSLDNNQLAAGFENVAYGPGVVTFGNTTIASGAFSMTQGRTTLTYGAYSHAEGEYSVAHGIASHAEGTNTITRGEYSHAEGNSAQSWGIASHAEGYATKTQGAYSHAEGMYTFTIGEHSHAEGEGTQAWEVGSHAEGKYTRALGKYSHAEGLFTSASGVASHTEGLYTIATGEGSHAEGQHTTSSGAHSHAEGDRTIASGVGSHAEGTVTRASGDYSHTEGKFTTASGDYSHAEGFNTTAEGANSHAEGRQTIASGYSSHAEGTLTTASANYAHAEGRKTQATGIGSHTEGTLTTASGDYSHAEGYKNYASASYSHAEGVLTQAKGLGSHTEGYQTKTFGQYSHAEGFATSASGQYAHAEGSATKASGDYSHAEAYQTVASGTGAHAEGIQTKATGNGAHAEGYQVTASGDYSHAEGSQTLASGGRSHAEGYQVTSSGGFSHAEGYRTEANALYSHAEGRNTITTGQWSHAEGYQTTASGIYSHAEGVGTQAIGAGAHAEGYYTQASGSFTHAGGRYTIATDDYSSVVGRFNSTSSLSGQSTIDLFVIGNGTNDSNRSNLIEFATNGIYINTGSLPTSDPGVLGKLYRTGSNSDELRVSLGS